MTTQLILLGTASPRITAERFQTSFALLIDGAVYVIDAGSGAYGRLIQALAKHGNGTAEVDLRHVFLTHLHPDHTLSLPSFIFGPYQLGRQEEINVYGPTGTQAMVDHLTEAYKVGIHELQYHGPREMPPVHVNVTEISPGLMFEDKRLKLEAIQVVHGNLEAYAFKATTADKTIFFSGDTCPVDILVEKAAGCDILIHEVYTASKLSQVPERWQWYFSKVHTSAKEVGKIAAQVKPGLLILNHQMYLGGTTDEELLQEIRDGGYTGEVVSGKDLQVF